MTAEISAYIFDLDDTLIDSSIYKRIYSEVITALLQHMKITEIELQEKISKLKEKTGKERIDTFDLCKELDALDLYYRVLERAISHTYMMKTQSIPSVFRRIKSKNKAIGVVSNSQERTIRMFLERFLLLEYVDFIESGKKDTVLFWISLEKKLGLEKEKTMVVDDKEEIREIAIHVGYNAVDAGEIPNLEI